MHSSETNLLKTAHLKAITMVQMHMIVMLTRTGVNLRTFIMSICEAYTFEVLSLSSIWKMNRIIYGLWSILILFSSHYEMNSSCKWPVLKLKKKEICIKQHFV